MPKSISRVKMFSRNSSWAYSGKIVGQLLSLIASVIIIRKLPVHVYGEYAIILTVVALINMISLSAIISINNRFIPEILENNDTVGIKKLLLWGFSIAAIFELFIIVSFPLIDEIIIELFKVSFLKGELLTFSIFVIAAFLKTLVDSLLRNMLLHKWIAVNAIISGLVRPLGYLIFIEVMSIHILLWIESLIMILNALLGFSALKKLYQSLSKTKIDKNSLNLKNRIVKYGLYASFNEIGIGIVGQTYDSFIIAAYSSQYLVGIYAVAQRVNSIIYQLIPVVEVQNILSNLFFRKYSRPKTDEKSIESIFSTILKILLIVHILPFTIFALYGQEIISSIFGVKYLEAYPIALVMIATSAITAYFFPQSMLINYYERMDIALWSKIIVIFSLIGGIWSMKYYGIFGVACSTLLGTIMAHCFMYIVLKRSYRIPYNLHQVKNIIFLSSAIFIIFKLLDSRLIGHINLIWKALVVFLIFTYSMIKTRIFKEDEVLYIEKILSSNKYSNALLRVIRHPK